MNKWTNKVLELTKGNFNTLRLVSIPFMRLILSVIAAGVLTDNGVNQFVAWAFSIMGIVWAFSFYYDECRFNKLEKRKHGNT